MKNIAKAIHLVSFAAVPLLYCCHTASAQEACAAMLQSSSQAMAKFDPELATTASEVKHVQAAGLDANRYIVTFEGQYVLLTVKFHAQAEKAISELAPSRNDASSCKADVMPYLEMEKLKMIYQHYGLGALLPPEMINTNYLKVVQSGDVPNESPAFMPPGKPDAMKDMAVGGETLEVIQKPYCIFGSCSAGSPFAK